MRLLIELDKLEEAGGRFAHTYEPGELALDDEGVRVSGPAEISGRASRSGNQVRLTGQIVARAEIDCDRCLKAIYVPVETKFDVQYVPAKEYARTDAAELQEEDLSLSTFDNDAIDVDELVREQVLLARPSRALCRADCKGLCPMCGADKNMVDCACERAETDPRLATLLKAVTSDE